MLDPLPDNFTQTREALHELAAKVISPARERVTGRIDLRATPDGFGTPLFEGDHCVRVEGAELIREGGGEPTTRDRLDAVDEAAARWLGAYYAFALDVLEALSAGWPADYDVSPPKLWPEHFDYAIEAGRVRANYGFSPGDADHPEPYAYVGPWEASPTGPLWNATAFPGAELSLQELLASPDPRATALEFMRERAEALHAEAQSSRS